MHHFTDIVVVALAIGIVISVVHYQITKKKSNSNGCEGGCSHCQFGAQCQTKKEDKSEK